MRIFRAARYRSLGRRFTVACFSRAVVLMFAGSIAAPFAALALRGFTDGLLGRQAGLALTFALLAAPPLVAQPTLNHFAYLDYFEVAELKQNRLRGEPMALVNGLLGIDHLDRADFADNAAGARRPVRSTWALEAVLKSAGLLLETAITAAYSSPWTRSSPSCRLRRRAGAAGAPWRRPPWNPPGSRLRNGSGSRSTSSTWRPASVQCGSARCSAATPAAGPAAAHPGRGDRDDVARPAEGRRLPRGRPGLLRPRLRRRHRARTGQCPAPARLGRRPGTRDHARDPGERAGLRRPRAAVAAADRRPDRRPDRGAAVDRRERTGSKENRPPGPRASVPGRLEHGIRSRTSASATRARPSRCCPASALTSRPARRLPSSGKTARGSPRSSSCSAACTCRPAGGSWPMAWTWPTSTRSSGGPGPPRSFRTSPASS